MTRRRKNSEASSAKRIRNEAEKVSHLQIDYSGPPFSDLPNSILVNILLKLSVKRILVCKCVCKTWYDLISDPEFSKIHFDQSEVYPLLRTSGFTLLSRMIYLVQPEHDVFESKPKTRNEYDSDESDYDFLFYWPKLKIRLDAKLKLPIRNFQMVNPNIEAGRDNHVKLNMKYHKYRIVNSCNGLLLLSDPSDNDPVIVCNPVTGEFIYLPEVRTVYDRGVNIACGLGLSPLSRQYKVIRMFNRWVINRKVMVAEVNVLGTNSWKDLEFFPESMYTYKQFTT